MRPSQSTDAQNPFLKITVTEPADLDGEKIAEIALCDSTKSDETRCKHILYFHDRHEEIQP